MSASDYDADFLARRPANFAPLTPLGLIARTASIYPERLALVDGTRRRTWGETFARCRRLASALNGLGIGRGDTVAVMAPNCAALLECHFGVSAAGAVLNALNTRLDAAALNYMLAHGEAKLLILHGDFAELLDGMLDGLRPRPKVVELSDAAPSGFADEDYESLLARGDPDAPWRLPDDEWDAITLNYTSGTTGDPKGVVYHHRGAYLNAIGNIQVWDLTRFPVYLWSLPMFHCNGWCFPWTVTALAGTHVCLRKVEAEAMTRLIAAEGVTHFCGAPIVLQTLLGSPVPERFEPPLKMMIAAAPPPASLLAAAAARSIEVTHVYGLTEVYGPATTCEWEPAWSGLDIEAQAELKARQGVAYPVLAGLAVADPESLAPLPRDGESLGEVLMRGNIVMKGYLKNPAATEAALGGGWFKTGDLAVWDDGGYIELKDRSKDIIISGGENISSIEIEAALYKHPAVAIAAVVAQPHPKWGETPCAFVELKPGADADAAELDVHCRRHLAGFKCPRGYVFGPVPRTSTGKIQKFALRQRAASLAAGDETPPERS